jgi:triosephosphate isomerase
MQQEKGEELFVIKPLIAGNWKMHKTAREAVAFTRTLKEKLGNPVDRDVVVAPPFTALFPVAKILKGSGIALAAQNVHDKTEGAYTGEISGKMLADIGCRYVIIGHSERRIIFGETDEIINRKVISAAQFGLKPIFCVGETLLERKTEKTSNVIERQIKEGLKNVSVNDIRTTVCAYEPVWAIGTSQTATPQQAQEVHAFIRALIGQMFGSSIADNFPILYGGSVNQNNIQGLMAQPDINGALAGGASLDLETFMKIVRF